MALRLVSVCAQFALPFVAATMLPPLSIGFGARELETEWTQARAWRVRDY